MIDKPVVAGGPAAYFMTVPVKRMVEKIRSGQIPASVSDTAGTFVCNHVAYGTRHSIETRYPGIRIGFIHIPYLTQQTVGMRNVASMSLELMVEGLTAAIEAIAEEE